MVIALLAFGASPAQAQFVRGARSDNIVNIAGVNYYVHTVQKGETLYSVGKLYGVDAADIVKNNPQAAEGLREGQAVKIPAEDARKSLADKLGMRRYEIHTVAQGETAYAISRRYGVSVQTLMEDNTDLDPLHLSVGQKLNIRRGSVGSQNERQIGEQWTQYAEALSSVTPGADYHLVRPGETLYGLG